MVEIKDHPSSSGIIELEKTFQAYKEKLELAEQKADEMRQVVKAEAGKVITEAKTKAVEAETMAKEQMSKAQKMAGEMMQAAKENCVIRIKETGRLIDEILQNAKNIHSQLQTRLQSEFAEFIIKINKIKETPDIQSILSKNAAGAGNDKKNDSDNLRGQTKLIVIPPYNEAQTKELVELLKQIPDIKISGTSTMEDNFLISLDIDEKIPLKNILASLSLVESSEFTGNSKIIKLKLKRYKIGGLPYY